MPDRTPDEAQIPVGSSGKSAYPLHAILKNKMARAAGLAIVTLAVLIWRRPDQLLHPYIWDETGIIILPSFLHHGWLSLFYPVQGYLLLPSKFIFLIAASTSFVHLPELAYWLTVVFTFLVLVSVAYSPTYLRLPMVCAVAVLLIPTDAEVFAVSLYAFWWGTLLLLVSALWRPDGGKTGLRLTLTIIGGLSSPLVVLLTPLFLLRACMFRAKQELVILGAVIVMAAIQISCLLISGNISHHASLDINPLILLEKFFGWFVFWSKHSHAGAWRSELIGAIVVFALLCTLFRNRSKLDAGHYLLVGCLVISILASIARAPLQSIHPVLAGPRYFFLPYILLAWLFIQAASVSGVYGRSLMVLLLAFSLHQTLLYGQRSHDTINWQAEVHACATAPHTYNLPVQKDGHLASTWKVTLKGSDCRELLSRSLY